MVDWIRRIISILGWQSLPLHAEKQPVPVEYSRDPLTIEEDLRALAMVAQQLPEIIRRCENVEAWPKEAHCPQCGATLPTALAQQCFQCGLDWHGRPRPEARSDPNQARDRPSSRSLFELLVESEWDHAEWSVRRSRWSEQRAWEFAGVAPEEVQVLKELISSCEGSKINDQVIDIRPMAFDELEVTTGWLGGPLMGRGAVWRIRRENDRWVITEKGGWVS